MSRKRVQNQIQFLDEVAFYSSDPCHWVSCIFQVYRVKFPLLKIVTSWLFFSNHPLPWRRNPRNDLDLWNNSNFELYPLGICQYSVNALKTVRLLQTSPLPSFLLRQLLPPSCWSVPCVATIAMIIISIKATCEYFWLLESNHPCLSILVHHPHLERSPLIAIRDATNPLWKAPLW